MSVPLPRFDVAICDSRHGHLERVFAALADALPTHGYRAIRFAWPRAFFDQPEQLAQAQVIAGFGDMPVTADVLLGAPRLRGVVSCVSGTDGIDLAAATAAGVVVAHAPTFENARSMAESALMLMLNLSYDLDGTRANFTQLGVRPKIVNAHMLHGQTIGIVGWGRIAANLVTLLEPWGVRVLVYSRRGAPADLPRHAMAATLDDSMAQSDKICILAGVQPNAPPLVGRAQLERMKPSAHLINLSRGSLVDEMALADALQAGRIAGAALDVFAVEPLAADSPLHQCRNVILTPHHVGHTQEADHSLIPTLIDNVLALLRGELPALVRNPEVAARWRQRLKGLSA